MNNIIYRKASVEFKKVSITKFGSKERPLWPIKPSALIELRELIALICEKYECKTSWKYTKIFPTAYLDDNVILGNEAIIDPGSVILGPCIIGSNTRVGPSAFVHEKCWIGENSVIGHCCEVKKSILLDGIKVFHYGFIGDSIIGYNTNIGAGTIFAVKRLDGKAININCPDEETYISSKKYGAIVGHEVQFGINSLVMPGAIIKPKSKIKPGTILGVK